MEIDERVKCLNSKTKLMICLVLESNKMSLPEIVRKIKVDFKNNSNRETIYRSIESLRKIGIVNKEYFPDERKIKYSLNIGKIEIDFLKKKIMFLKK